MVEWSCTKEKINERPYVLVEWSCAHKRNKSMRTLIFGRMVVHKRKIKWKRGSYILVEWSCVSKRNKSVETLNSGRMVVHIALAKITVREGSISPYSFCGQMLDCSVCDFQSMNSPMELNRLFSKFFCYIYIFFCIFFYFCCEFAKMTDS